MNTLTPVAAGADFLTELAQHSAQPLWDRYHRITRRMPAAQDAPWHWPWAVTEPLITRAVREVGLDDAERRVLLLTHPAFGGAAATTTNLSAGLQTLLPGEVARAHRHALQAIRFVLQGQGAVTSVNDTACPMAEGDLILTPAWTWHEHVHPGAGRVVWFDGLDLPLCAHLDTMFFELGAPQRSSVEPSPTRASVLPQSVATLASDADAVSGGSRFCYSAARAAAVLQAVPVSADGSRLLRYIDGRSGGAVLPTLDCYQLACAQGRPTTRRRSTSNAVCVVLRGEGSSVVGGTRIEWSRNDVFTVPHWSWVSHTARSADAVIFMMTDREMVASLGYLREEESLA